MYVGVVANGLHSLPLGLHGFGSGRLQVRCTAGAYAYAYIYVCMYVVCIIMCIPLRIV